MRECTRERRRVAVLAGTLAVAAAVTVSACGSGTAAGTYVGDGSVQSVADELRAEGRAAYYLGPEASGLALTDVTRVTENGPEFQVWASYGTCHPAMFDDGGCMDPLSVSTLEWRPDVTGVTCQRLEPQLGVPAGLVMGELTLFTERVQVGVVHVDDLADYDGHRGLALLKDLRAIGATQPVGTLPPPDPEVATWVDGFCGTVPGASVEHPMEEEPPANPAEEPPANPAEDPAVNPAEDLDNTHVPDFTVDLLGGGSFSWSQQRGTPVVLAVGTVDQVTGALQRLAATVPASPGGAKLAGLVAELDQPKGRPRPVGDGWESGLIAFVDSSGAVRRFLPMDASVSELQAATDDLGRGSAS
jgi:hypothetical protein